MSALEVEGFVGEPEFAQVVQLHGYRETDDEKRARLELEQRMRRTRMGEILLRLSEVSAEQMECLAEIMRGDAELRALGGDVDALKRDVLSQISPTSAAADYGNSHLG